MKRNRKVQLILREKKEVNWNWFQVGLDIGMPWYWIGRQRLQSNYHKYVQELKKNLVLMNVQIENLNRDENYRKKNQMKILKLKRTITKIR